jgi:exodeoxyribonuclease VII small subunit
MKERTGSMEKEKNTSTAGFEENFKKLEKLSQELQENRISIDELVPKMKEAVAAIKVCKEVLRETKAQLKEISAEFIETGSEKE